MRADPKRKTRLALCLLIGLSGGFVGGCASREPASAPVPVEIRPSEAKQVSPASPLPTPSLAPAPAAARSQSLRLAPAPEKLPEEWIYRKSGPARSPLSLFEESILLGQVRSKLKTIPEATKVESIKVQNRVVWLGVTPGLTGAKAARIGDTLLKETRVDEVRIRTIH